MRQALALRKLFEFVGDRLNIHLEVMITDGRQPIGLGIGPVLEARDVMKVLNNDPDAPADLRQKSLQLAGRIIEFDPDVRGGQGYAIARDILESGRACAKMNNIIKAQGEKEIDLQPGELCYQVCADRDGVVTHIDNFQTAKIARIAGAPMDKKAGVDLFKKLGDKVSKGEPLFQIHAEFPADFIFAKNLAQQNNAYSIGDDEQVLKPLIAF
jgi:thymidine phosphorylase